MTRRLSDLNLDLVKEGRATVRGTRETIERSREILNSSNDGSFGSGYQAPLSGQSVRCNAVVDPAAIIVIGGSAGSTVGFRAVMNRLPQCLPAAIFIVQHTSPTWHTGWSAELLQAHSKLPVHVASDLEPFRSGRIYICPSNHHLSLEDGLIRTEKSPVENLTRPSIDVTFRSAATVYGRRVIGVLLSGTLMDGTAGLWQIKKRGGIAMVQDPAEAEYPDMPRNAVEHVAVDYVLGASSIGDKLVDLVEQHRSDSRRTPESPRILIVEDEPLVAQNLEEQLGQLSYPICDSVKSGEDAIAAATEKNPDLILMDIKLAGRMNGVEAARQIRERLQIPVVFVTAHADLTTLAEVKSTDNYGFVVKPFHSASIQAAVELALDRRKKELRRSS